MNDDAWRFVMSWLPGGEERNSPDAAFITIDDDLQRIWYANVKVSWKSGSVSVFIWLIFLVDY